MQKTLAPDTVSISTYKEQEELLFRTTARLKGVFFYRFFSILLLSGALSYYSIPAAHETAFILAISSLIGLNILHVYLGYVGKDCRFPPNWVATAEILGFTLLASFTGGLKSYFIFFYLLLQLHTATWFNRGLSWQIGAICSVALAALYWHDAAADTPHFLALLLLMLGMMIGSGEIASLVSRARERMAEAAVELIRANREVMHKRDELQASEEALRELNSELEDRVAKRTQQLETSNQQLQDALRTLTRAQEELVRSEKLASLGSLVAGVAHELNTPLGNSVTVATSLNEKLDTFTAEVESGNLRRSSLTEFLEQAHKAMQMLTGNLFKASELIMHFKQVAVDQTSTQRRPFDLSTMLEEVALTLQPQFKGTHNHLELVIPGGITLDSYPGPLGQVVTNLVNNALLHGLADKQGAGLIRLEAERQGETVRLTVTDDGKGIPEEIQGKVFDPFFTTRLGQGGSGLGLHIVYSMVTRLLGGQITMFSTPGAGTSFVVDIPVVAPQEAARDTVSDPDIIKAQ